jgi:hypothetical protein
MDVSGATSETTPSTDDEGALGESYFHVLSFEIVF